MRGTLLALALTCGLPWSAAMGQAGVLYRLEPEGNLRQDHCLGPCLCVPFFDKGTIAGTFTLTFQAPGPVFTTYRVTGVSWTATLPSGPVTFAGSGTYQTTGPGQQMSLQLTASSPPWPAPQPYGSGLTVTEPGHQFPRIAITIQAPVQACDQNTVRVVASPVPCQADCDASGGLTANDFQCYINKFIAGDPYANCDGSTTPPAFNANDFQCYLNRFAMGCS